jgi:RNA polymerase I-specific transcription initiation factor RRN3
VQIELEELEEQATSQRLGEVFELDPFDTIIGQEEDSDIEGDDRDDGDNFSDISSDAGQPDDDDNEHPADTALDFNHIQDMVNKLDAMLKLVFDFFNSTHAALDPATSFSSTNSSRSNTPLSPVNPPPTSPRPSSPASTEYGKLLRRSQFHTLLSIFDRTIIRTFKSRHTQFLIFWYSSLDPEFSDLFQGMLIEKALLDENQPTITRAAAVSYIASFVSRAQFVDRQSTRNVISVLCDFLSGRLDGLEVVIRGGGELSMAQCTMFYAITQAVFLIFCFRWRDLLEEQADDVDELSGSAVVGGGPVKKWMRKLDVIQRVISSELNPLKVGFAFFDPSIHTDCCYL